MQKHRMALVATLAAALGACGSEDQRTHVPGAEMGEPAAYYGLEPCTCYEYVPVGGGLSRLGVAVEQFAANGDHIVRYRHSGSIVREDAFLPSDPDLQLKWVTTRDAEGEQTGWVLEPGAPFLRYPVGRQQVIETTVQVRPGPDAEPEAVRFVANYSTDTVEASLDGGETMESFEAVRVSYPGLPWSEQPRHFVPEVGWVRLELDIAGERTRWVLNRKLEMPRGCPGKSGAFTCGISND